jgi:hypothetical protein
VNAIVLDFLTQGAGPNARPHPTRTFGELLIDLEEDKAARAVLFGLLREMERK